MYVPNFTLFDGKFHKLRQLYYIRCITNKAHISQFPINSNVFWFMCMILSEWVNRFSLKISTFSNLIFWNETKSQKVYYIKLILYVYTIVVPDIMVWVNKINLSGRFKSKETDFVGFIIQKFISWECKSNFYVFVSKNSQHYVVLEYILVFF